MQELVRTIVLTVAVGIFVVTYLKLIASAFRRDTLWGVFSVACPPLGGCLHAITTWWENSWLFVVHFIAGALSFFAFFLFPRAPMTGFWTDDAGKIVWEVKADGSVRDRGLAPDCTWQQRPARVLTKDLPFKSPLRLRFTGSRQFDIGWYRPGDGTIRLYNVARDPSLITNLDKPLAELRRVADPAAPAFVAQLESMAVKEALADCARSLVQDSRAKPVADLLTEDSRARLTKYIALARGEKSASSQPLTDQIYALFLRTRLHAQLKQNATADAVLSALLNESNFLQFAVLREMDIESVEIKESAGTVLFARDERDTQRLPRSAVLHATKGKDGLWRIDPFQFRDPLIRQAVGGKQGFVPQSAEEYLEYDAATAGRRMR